MITKKNILQKTKKNVKKIHLHKHNQNLFNENIIECSTILNFESKDSSITNIQTTLHLEFQ
jgi:hypothetical protein